MDEANEHAVATAQNLFERVSDIRHPELELELATDV